MFQDANRYNNFLFKAKGKTCQRTDVTPPLPATTALPLARLLGEEKSINQKASNNMQSESFDLK